MNWTPKTMGSKGGKAPKHLTAEERQRRADWARGLASKRAAKRAAAQAVLGRFVVIDRRGARWPYTAETVQHAITLARHDGIDAIAGRAERGEHKQ